MKKLPKLFTKQELKSLLLKLILPSKGKMVILFGFGLIGVSFWEAVTNSVAKYFEPNIDGTTNMVKGFCKCDFKSRTPGDILPTVLWNSCDGFEKTNIVSIIDAISKDSVNK